MSSEMKGWPKTAAPSVCGGPGWLEWLERRQTQYLIVLSPCNYSSRLWGGIMAWSLPLSSSHSISPHSSLMKCDGDKHLCLHGASPLMEWKMLCFFPFKQDMNSYYHPSLTSYIARPSFLSMCFCITESVWEIVLCRGLILYSESVCLCVYLWENWKLSRVISAVLSQIGLLKLLTSSTAAWPKKLGLMLFKIHSFSSGILNPMHLIIVILLLVISKTKEVAVVVPLCFYFTLRIITWLLWLYSHLLGPIWFHQRFEVLYVPRNTLIVFLCHFWIYNPSTSQG